VSRLMKGGWSRITFPSFPSFSRSQSTFLFVSVGFNVELRLCFGPGTALSLSSHRSTFVELRYCNGKTASILPTLILRSFQAS
jgi:hypothetical protein